VKVEDLIRRDLSVLKPESLDILDESGQHAGHAGAASGGHFRMLIVSGQFSGRTLQARHRLVYDALGPLPARGIHALSITAYAPDEI